MSERAFPPQPQPLSRQALYDLVWAEPLAQAAARLGLSANGLAKMCDRQIVPRPSRNHWTRGADRNERPSLGPPPFDVDGATVGVGAAPRRRRTRLSLEDRRDQLMDEAARVALAEGLHTVSIKRVARNVGISEAQAHNCFAGRSDLILTLARREIAAVERTRRKQIGRGRDRITWIVLSTLGYLHAAAERGPLLQMLLRNAEVRAVLRPERVAATTEMRGPIMEGMVSRYAVPRPIAHASTAILTAICLRAGGLIASGRIDLELAERLCLPIIIAGSRSNARAGLVGGQAGE